MNTDTLYTLERMTKPLWDRMVEGEDTELQMWHVDISEFRFCRPVTIVQTYRSYRDSFLKLYLCETDNRQRIESSDLMDHEPVLTADEAGARCWQ